MNAQLWLPIIPWVNPTCVVLPTQTGHIQEEVWERILSQKLKLTAILEMKKNVCGGGVEKFYTFKTEMNGVLLMTGNTVSGEGGGNGRWIGY